MPDSRPLIGASFSYQHDLIEIPFPQLRLRFLEGEFLKDDFYE